MDIKNSPLTHQKDPHRLSLLPRYVALPRKRPANLASRTAILGASWLVLQSPTERAIPEFFLRTLIEEGIEPILLRPSRLQQPAGLTFTCLNSILNIIPIAIESLLYITTFTPPPMSHVRC
jgi:hypothetical protein